MQTQHIALVPEAADFDLSELVRVSAALQKQVTCDLAPIWEISATVDPFTRLENVPVGYLPILVTRGELGSQAGIHVDKHGYPYAQIGWSRDWSLAASRTCLELLVNPYEQRTVTATSPRLDQGPVEFFIEPCAPCEHARHAYLVNDVPVSDFATPEFFGGARRTQRYSYLNALGAPLRPEPGGHVTWYDWMSGNLWLRSHYRDNPIDTQLGPLNRRVASVRELVQACAALRPADAHDAMFEHAARSALGLRASEVRAQRLRSQLADPLETEVDAAIDRLAGPRAQPRARRVVDRRVSDARFADARVIHEVRDVEVRDAPQARASSSAPPPPLPKRPAPRIDVADDVAAQKPSARVQVQAAEPSRSRAAGGFVVGLSTAALLGLAWQAVREGQSEAPRGTQAKEASAVVAEAAPQRAPAASTALQPSAEPRTEPTAPAPPAAPAILTSAAAHGVVRRPVVVIRPRAAEVPEPAPERAPAAPAAATPRPTTSLDALLDSRE